MVCHHLVDDILEVHIQVANENEQQECVRVAGDGLSVEPLGDVLDDVVRSVEVVAHQDALFNFRTKKMRFENIAVAEVRYEWSHCCGEARQVTGAFEENPVLLDQ